MLSVGEPITPIGKNRLLSVDILVTLHTCMYAEHVIVREGPFKCTARGWESRGVKGGRGNCYFGQQSALDTGATYTSAVVVWAKANLRNSK